MKEFRIGNKEIIQGNRIDNYSLALQKYSSVILHLFALLLHNIDIFVFCTFWNRIYEFLIWYNIMVVENCILYLA